MPLQSIPLTPALEKELCEIFQDMDVSLIKDVLYLDSWSTYEEHGGVLIFQGIDDSYQYCEFGHCVMANSDEEDHFIPNEISYEMAQDMANRWDSNLEENESWWSNNS